jgi:aspartyl-tRNA(Asn)/glutamyl-tRNA(Gln) amidotransferase subunit A
VGPNALCNLTIAQASALIGSGDLSPVELVDAHLGRIAATNEGLNTVITVLEKEARAAAKSAEAEIAAGTHRRPLHGIPIGLKDLVYTKNIRTTQGSDVWKDFVPDYDATIVTKFDDAGAITLAKTHLNEFAMGATGENRTFGPARNPWNTTRMTGGSSSGSAAGLAARQFMGAIGSDTGGSVRIPASLCGIVGLKPTFGRVSRRGIFPMSWSLDTVGPMARTVEDTALMMNAIGGHDPLDTASSRHPHEDYTSKLGHDVKGLRVGIPRKFLFDVIDPQVEAAVLEAAKVLEGLGAIVEEVVIPYIEYSRPIGMFISNVEGADLHRETLKNNPESIDPEALSRLDPGLFITGGQYVRAQRARAFFNQQVFDAMKNVDIFLMQATPVAATPIGQDEIQVGEETMQRLSVMTHTSRPFNLCGFPAIVQPCGFTSENLPIGLQLVGRPFEDTTVLQIAHAYEHATEWHQRRPKLDLA